MLTTGTKKYTEQQLADELDKLGATLSTDAGWPRWGPPFQGEAKTLPQC